MFVGMVSLVLSKSGRGVLFYPGDGSVHVSSVKFVRMLLDSELRGNLLVFKMLGEANDNGRGDLGSRKVKGSSGQVKLGSGDVDI